MAKRKDLIILLYLVFFFIAIAIRSQAFSNGNFFANFQNGLSRIPLGRVISFQSYDTTPPTAQVTSPSANSWQRTDFTAGLLYQDDTQLQTCYYRVLKRQVGGSWNSPAWSSVACSGTSYSAGLLVTVGSAGYCNYQSTDGITTTCRAEVYAEDAAGNVGPTPPAAREWRIDYTAPTGDININPTAPTSADTVTYTATGSDTYSGLSQIRIYVDGGLRKTCASSPCSWTDNINSPYSAGSTHNYYAVIYDIAGNSNTTATKTFTVNAVCNNNGICEVYALNIGENQTGCPHDCYTVAYFTPYQNLLPGQEVAVTVYFNDSRWDSSRDASLNLTIDGKGWTECQVHNKRWKINIGWPGGDGIWSSTYGGKPIQITSYLGYARLETNCSLPTWLGSGSHYFVATPTIYSKPTVLTPAITRFTVGISSTPSVSSLDLFLQFLKSLLLLKIF
jgi:hypothetical protein